MKQGKTEKAVFAKLSTEKVELNASSNLKKMIDLLDADIKKYDKALMDVQNAYMQFKKAYQYAERLEGQLEMGRKTVVAQVDDVEAQAKELGVTANNVPLIKQAKSVIDEAREYKGVLSEDFGKGMK